MKVVPASNARPVSLPRGPAGIGASDRRDSRHRWCPPSTVGRYWCSSEPEEIPSTSEGMHRDSGRPVITA